MRIAAPAVSREMQRLTFPRKMVDAAMGRGEAPYGRLPLFFLLLALISPMTSAYSCSRITSPLFATHSPFPAKEKPQVLASRRSQQYSFLKRSFLSVSKGEPSTTTRTPEDADLPTVGKAAGGGGGGGLEIAAVVTGNPPLMVTLDDGSQHSYTDAIQRTLVWVGAAILFGGGLWFTAGVQTGQEFFAGYLVEQSLSVDNLFVFLLLFDYFKVPLSYQDRVLNWGIYGAIVMRAFMIGIGAAALQRYHAILLAFAAILIYSSARFFIGGGDDEEEDPGQNAIVQFSRSLIKSTDHFDGDRFFTLVDGARQATPLFICMIAVEISDVVFAVDSIPAVFGVTEVCLTVENHSCHMLTVPLTRLPSFFHNRMLLSCFRPTSSQLWA